MVTKRAAKKKQPIKTKPKAAPKKRAAGKAAPKAKRAAKSKIKAKPARPKAKQRPRAKPAGKGAANKARRAPAKRKFASIDELARAWNEQGRAYYAEYSERLTRYYQGDSDVDLELQDPRSREMGDQVMRAVIDLNARGEADRARVLFDPAYSPLFSWVEKNKRNLPFVAILGPDELLVHRGAAWQRDGVTFHLHGDRAVPIADVRGVHRSRNRDHLVLAREAGLEIRDARAGVAGLDGPPIATIPWPDPDVFRPRGLGAGAEWEPVAGPLEIEQLEVSDDGMRVAVSCYRQGILLASRHPGEQAWTLLWPDARPPYHRRDDGRAPSAGDMTHVAISRDGTRLAWGSQDAGHFLAEIDGPPKWYATVGHLSEYPHYACFSADGRYVALNSCHFYHGATIAFDWEGNRGVELDSYERHPQAPCIDQTLRVYAACWVDRPVLDAMIGAEPSSDGAFVLAGAGIMRFCTAKGGLGGVQGFGSSAGSIDFCPESRRLAVAGYSGFVHLYDPYADELPGRIDGYRPRRELTRWVMWEHLPAGPVRW